MEKKILIIYSHPKENSLNHFILENYIEKLKKQKIKYSIIDLYKDNFNPCYTISRKELEEPLVKKYQKLIIESDHLTFIFPTWWFNYPAILKGFFDKVLSSGFAFKYNSYGIPIKFLKGKTATIIRTFGGPYWYARLMGGSSTKELKSGTLGFCGIKVKQTFNLYKVNMKSFNKNKLNKFITKIKKSISRI